MSRSEPIAYLAPSPGRRVFAIATLALLGALLIYLALASPPALGWQVFLVAFGALSLASADAMRRATRTHLVLYEDRIEEATGRLVVRLGDIRRVERGLFAFKPSNGFVLILHDRMDRAWALGLWWRIGRRVGIGGITSAAPGKFMAEQIAARIPGD